jgi:hypothetical protein
LFSELSSLYEESIVRENNKTEKQNKTKINEEISSEIALLSLSCQMLCQMLRGARGRVEMEGRLVIETCSFIG